MTAALAYYTDRKPLKLAAWLANFVMCFACLFTMSRGAWVGMAIAVVLFILLGFLEGCGYMARVAFIMDLSLIHI